MNRLDIYQSVTDSIVRALENGCTTDDNWKAPWNNSSAHRSINGRIYRGINQFVLALASDSANYPSSIWGTFKAWRAAGPNLCVRKGERATKVVFWKIGEATVAATGEKRKTFFAQSYPVFNAAQIAGYIPAPAPPPVPQSAREQVVSETLLAYLSRESIPLSHGGSRAFYAPSSDSIHLPASSDFTSPESYLATLAHESIHSTGHAKRLDRTLNRGRFGDEAYAFEELIAELGAAFTLGASGLRTTPRPDHAHYLASWLSVLRGDNRAIFSAASKAQAAADMVLGTSAKTESAPEPLATVAAIAA
jgi:antirestriction protein ArdC